MLRPIPFFAGSRTPDAEAIERRVREAADAGCDLFDVGGYSSRSGAAEVTPEEEWRRVEAGVAAVRRIAPALPVSVDTFRAEVARRVLETFGPVIVNDISAGELDPAIVDVVAEYDVPLYRYAHAGYSCDDAGDDLLPRCSGGGRFLFPAPCRAVASLRRASVDSRSWLRVRQNPRTELRSASGAAQPFARWAIPYWPECRASP